MAKAIVLLSGGLDSLLTVLTLVRQGIDVTAIKFSTDFGCNIGDVENRVEGYDYKVKCCHLSDKFIEIVKNPSYGYGKNMNPCIDCRILMLKEAKILMDDIGADFLATGEVVGQRPMSQRKQLFPFIDEKAGVEGIVVRPLSAKLLKPTEPELKGIVDRSQFFSFNGRSRRSQIALAKEFGLSAYPVPAGGCLLTDPIYSHRLQELISHNPNPVIKEFKFLKYGRHFRLENKQKVIVGRNEKENDLLFENLGNDDMIFIAQNTGSPLTLIPFTDNETSIQTAAALTARYSGAKQKPLVDVHVFRGKSEEPVAKLAIAPASNKFIKTYIVEPSVEKTST